MGYANGKVAKSNSMGLLRGNIPLQTAKAVIKQAFKAGQATRRYLNQRSGGRREKVDLVTGQKDYATIRVNKKASRRKRKWKKFTRRVRRANAQGRMMTLVKTATQRVFVDAAALNVTREGNVLYGGVGRQAIANITLCGLSETNQQMNDDINEMLSILFREQALVTDQNLSGEGLYIKSALWEIMMKNNGTNAQYCDVYHYVCSRSGVYDATALISATDAQVRSGPVPSGGTNYLTQPAVEDYGWTPYQNRQLMRHIKIYRKERYLMPPGDTVQIEKRIAINKVYRKHQTSGTLSTVQNKMHKGITHGMMFIVYGTPAGTGNSAITGTSDLVLSVNKTIFFGRSTREESNGPGDLDWRTYT